MQIRLQLFGEVEQWIRTEESEIETWMKSGDTLLEKLAKRYETAEGRETAIKAFEESAV